MYVYVYINSKLEEIGYFVDRKMNKAIHIVTIELYPSTIYSFQSGLTHAFNS